MFHNYDAEGLVSSGRRGEEIKQEEIDKEIVRRNRLQQKRKKN
jgi:hypothetical protein